MKVFSRHWVSGQEPWWAPVGGLYVAPGAPGTDDPAPGGGGNPNPPADPPSPELGPDGKPWDPRRAGETIQNLRQYETQAKQLERELKEAKAQLDAHETEKLSELEKANKKAAELAASNLAMANQMREQTLRLSVMQEASKLDFSDPDDAMAYVALHRPEVEFEDASGNPTNVHKLLKAAIDAKPYLKKTTRTPIPGTPTGGSSDTQEQVAKAMESSLRGAGGYAPY